MSKANLPATLPSATAFILGVASPTENIPKITPKKQDKMSPAE